MKLIKTICAVIILLVVWASQVHAITLTFDDIPHGHGLDYYAIMYGINCPGLPFSIVNHIGSAWGPPHSGNNVLIWNEGWGRWDQSPWMFKNNSGSLYAYTVGGYFSTEQGVVLEMIGYHNSMDNPVASVFIGTYGASWSNVHVQIDSAEGINGFAFRPVTTDALLHFCADDINVEFVPEPASFLTLGVALAGVGIGAVRRRR